MANSLQPEIYRSMIDEPHYEGTEGLPRDWHPMSPASLRRIYNENYEQRGLVLPDHEALHKPTDMVPYSEIHSEETMTIIQKLQTVMNDMQAEGKTAPVGVSANQIGISKRIFVIDGKFQNRGDKESQRIAFVNPRTLQPEMYIPQEHDSMLSEGCFSCLSAFCRIRRPSSVEAKADAIYVDNELIDVTELTLDGFLARVYLHELDHVNGKTIIDTVKDQIERFGEHRNRRLAAQAIWGPDELRKERVRRIRSGDFTWDYFLREREGIIRNMPGNIPETQLDAISSGEYDIRKFSS